MQIVGVDCDDICLKAWRDRIIDTTRCVEVLAAVRYELGTQEGMSTIDRAREVYEFAVRMGFNNPGIRPEAAGEAEARLPTFQRDADSAHVPISDREGEARAGGPLT